MALVRLAEVFLGRLKNLREKPIKFSEMCPVDEAVECLGGHGDVSRSIKFAKKESGYTVNPRVAPGVGCRQYRDVWHAAKIDQALDIAALGAKGWALVGAGPRRTDIVAEYRKVIVKFCNTIAMQ